MIFPLGSYDVEAVKNHTSFDSQHLSTDWLLGYNILQEYTLGTFPTFKTREFSLL